MTDNPLLVALTTEAVASAGVAEIPVSTFPFRVGRESRVAIVDHELHFHERRKNNTPPSNDIYLRDRGELLNISREHLQIEKDDNGNYSVFDRGSACGTQVDDARIGGEDRTGRLPLRDGSVITIGNSESPYRFQFKLP